MRIFIGALGAWVLVGGCAGDPSPEPPADVTVIDEAALAEGPAGEPVILDLRDENAVFVLDPTRGLIDESRLMLLCPDGSLMGMRRWLDLLENDLGEDPRGDGPWSIGTRLAATEQALLAVAATLEERGCVEDCQYCPDGAYVCRMRCPDAEPRTVVGDDSHWTWWWWTHASDDGGDPGPSDPFGGGSGGGSGGSTPGGSGSFGSGSGSGGSGSGSGGSGPGSGPGGQPPR